MVVSVFLSDAKMHFPRDEAGRPEFAKRLLEAPHFHPRVVEVGQRRLRCHGSLSFAGYLQCRTRSYSPPRGLWKWRSRSVHSSENRLSFGSDTSEQTAQSASGPVVQLLRQPQPDRRVDAYASPGIDVVCLDALLEWFVSGVVDVPAADHDPAAVELEPQDWVVERHPG